MLFTNLFQNQGSDVREQLRMLCKVCLNGAATHKAPQTPTCGNYCNLHLRLAQTSHASKRQTAGRPQRGRPFSLVSRNSAFLRLLTGLVRSDVHCCFSRVHTCTSSVFPLPPFGPTIIPKTKDQKCAVCLTVESTWLNVLACAFSHPLSFSFFFPIAQINRCYLHYKQAQSLLGEAKYVGGKQGRKTMIKQVCRWEARAARPRLFFCSLSFILWSQNVIALNFLIPSGVHAILRFFFAFFAIWPS